MKIFKEIQRQYAILGIRSPQQSTQKYPVSKRALVGFLLFGCNFVSHFVYIFHVANGFLEQMECICATYASILIFVCFATIVFKRTLLFKTIDRIERLVDKSEWWFAIEFFMDSAAKVVNVVKLQLWIKLKLFTF